MSCQLWKPFADDAQPPRWFPATRRLPEPIAGKVNVTAFGSGWCMAHNLLCERAKRAAAELGDRVVVREIDTSARSEVAAWGRSDAVLVDGRDLQKGPPPSQGGRKVGSGPPVPVPVPVPVPDRPLPGTGTGTGTETGHMVGAPGAALAGHLAIARAPGS